MNVEDLPTPAVVVDAARLEGNLATMARARPGDRLRPHVKAHKTTALAKRQLAHGHTHFCAATIREIEGMVRAGLDEDLLLANEVVDASRLGALVRAGARVTVAVDSEETIEAARRGGVEEVLIDVDVGLPRCGCRPEDAGPLAEKARRLGLRVRGVMGYEGHVVGNANRADRERGCAESMRTLLSAHAEVGGDVISAGGTGTYACNLEATEIQAGSYALMDTAYAKLELPFEQAFHLMSTVLSVSERHAVGDVGLKSLAMDHGNPTIPGAQVLFCSDEHVTFVPGASDETASVSPIDWSCPSRLRVGDRIRLVPAHVDPTLACHEKIFVAENDRVVDEWEIDLRGW
ncbi:MAG TPA: metal-activated pyridoxal enzyme [Deltaproteobacteria bacterium]|nr:metal-activated pyridoxal enzyme [Deltaproteobacteria bacterium]